MLIIYILINRRSCEQDLMNRFKRFESLEWIKSADSKFSRDQRGTEAAPPSFTEDTRSGRVYSALRLVIGPGPSSLVLRMLSDLSSSSVFTAHENGRRRCCRDFTERNKNCFHTRLNRMDSTWMRLSRTWRRALYSSWTWVCCESVNAHSLAQANRREVAWTRSGTSGTGESNGRPEKSPVRHSRLLQQHISTGYQEAPAGGRRERTEPRQRNRKCCRRAVRYRHNIPGHRRAQSHTATEPEPVRTQRAEICRV